MVGRIPERQGNSDKLMNLQLSTPKTCPDCGADQISLVFQYKPDLVPFGVLERIDDFGNQFGERVVRFIRCGNPMGYAHYSERIESAS